MRVVKQYEMWLPDGLWTEKRLQKESREMAVERECQNGVK